MEDGKQKPHAIFIPYPLQGHVIPSIHLATKLATLGFTITFVNTKSIHQQITKSHQTPGGCDIFSGARESGLDIRYDTISDGFPVGFDRSLNHDQFMEGLLNVFSAHVDEFVGELVKSNLVPKVSILIADTFYVWTSMIANKYKLVNVSFWTEPALVLNLYYHLDLLKMHGHFGSQENRKDTIKYIPGVSHIEPNDLMSYLQPSAKETSTVVHRIISKAFTEVKNADFVLINTVQSLENQCISALNDTNPTYAIGPIFSTTFTNNTKVPTSLWAQSDCTNWLDSKPVSSVLYLSFGSYAHTSQRVIHAIANGVLASRVNFIWVVRPDIVSSDHPNPLPDGFEEKANGRGLVVTWCNQIKILSHKSVSGFLTHCGWNSILESTWCMVPLLCFPLLTDQFTNRKLVVDDWKTGINLCRGDNVVREEDVCRKISCLMRGESAHVLKQRVTEVKKQLENAWGQDGSSHRNFQLFVQSVITKSTQN